MKHPGVRRVAIAAGTGSCAFSSSPAANHGIEAQYVGAAEGSVASAKSSARETESAWGCRRPVFSEGVGGDGIRRVDGAHGWTVSVREIGRSACRLTLRGHLVL